MPLAFSGARQPGTGGAPSSGGMGATVGFGAVAAAAAFAVAVHKAARLRSPLRLSHYQTSVAEDGTVPEFETILQHIADKGLEPEARPEVWPLLLGLYGANETYEQRAASHKELQVAFEALLRRCQEREVACLEATSSSRRSARASSSCCGQALQSPSSTTSASASPLYSKSPPHIGRVLGGLSSGGVATNSTSDGDGRCGELPHVATPIQIHVSNIDDGSWGKLPAAATAAASDGQWEEDGLYPGPGGDAGGGGALSASSEASFLGHVSRSDVPPELRPFWEAQHSIALDAVRTDFKKSQLPGATLLATAAAGNGVAVSGLTVSLRGLGITGFTGNGSATPMVPNAAVSPAASGLMAAASAPALTGLDGGGGGVANGADATTINSSVASSGGGGGRIASWIREKVEEYQASRAARQQQHQQLPRQELERQDQEMSEVSPAQPCQGSASPTEDSNLHSCKMQMTKVVTPSELHEDQALDLQCGVYGTQMPMETFGEPPRRIYPGLCGDIRGGSEGVGYNCDCRSVIAATLIDTTTTAAVQEQAREAVLDSHAASIPSSEVEAGHAAAARDNPEVNADIPVFRLGGSGGEGGRGEAVTDDGICVATPSTVAPGTSPVLAGPSRSTDSRVRSRWASAFSFSTRMRSLVSAATLSPMCPAASCPSSPIQQNDSPSCHKSEQGIDGQGQNCRSCTPTASSLPSATNTPRHASEGGASRGFSTAGDVSVVDRAGSAQVSAIPGAAGGGGGGVSSTGRWPCVSTLARFHLDHASHFSIEQMRVVERLVMLLSAYAIYDPGLGYCQGMSDLALPFVLLFEDDVVAFWCFVRLMDKVRGNFLPRSDGVFEGLAKLGSLLATLDPPMAAHLAALHADHCHFAHRMVAVQMRRELSAELAVRVWEQLWADDLLEALVERRSQAARSRAAEADTMELAELIDGTVAAGRSDALLTPSTQHQFKVIFALNDPEMAEERGTNRNRIEQCQEKENLAAARDQQCGEAAGMDNACIECQAGGSERGGVLANRNADSEGVNQGASVPRSDGIAGGPFGIGVAEALTAALKSSCTHGSHGQEAEAAPSEDVSGIIEVGGSGDSSMGVSTGSATAKEASVWDIASHGSGNVAATHRFLHGRAAAVSYCEGFTGCQPASSAVSLPSDFAPALSCDGAEVEEGTNRTAASVAAAATIGAPAPVRECRERNDRADLPAGGMAGGGDDEDAGKSSAPYCGDAPTEAAPAAAPADAELGIAAAVDPPTSAAGTATTAISRTDCVSKNAASAPPDQMKGSNDNVNAASVTPPGKAAGASASAVPAVGRELFLYLVASVVLSHRRKLLECWELDDVLRLFHSLAPLSRSEVNDALRRAREYRERVAHRPPTQLPDEVSTMPTAKLSARLPLLSSPAATAKSLASVAEVQPPPASERVWRLMSFRSDPPKAKL